MAFIVTVAARTVGVGKTMPAYELAWLLDAPLVDLEFDDGSATRMWGYRDADRVRAPLLDALGQGRSPVSPMVRQRSRRAMPPPRAPVRGVTRDLGRPRTGPPIGGVRRHGAGTRPAAHRRLFLPRAPAARDAGCLCGRDPAAGEADLLCRPGHRPVPGGRPDPGSHPAAARRRVAQRGRPARPAPAPGEDDPRTRQGPARRPADGPDEDRPRSRSRVLG